ncbi:hypothetical protein HCBG_05618 [Histoplasma capsulatum G186AR]|uniref:Uncharacterized protein n=1 Tax=Ajellomyces capsulatus (strain G186AR / H82 / ATCC MYA-2454 / RMSCC 2432) TaxID=447093 RepID=C0NRI8_AJECG|nr:uncharacterized protein HCBG_05618 [Histoplasma capsulatum G186AR]EEH06302.1 hypothetical protein HCBG_05618 [Histoplasma capsulatum G186AR]
MGQPWNLAAARKLEEANGDEEILVSLELKCRSSAYGRPLSAAALLGAAGCAGGGVDVHGDYGLEMWPGSN